MSDSYIALVEKSIDERTQQYQELLQLRAEKENLQKELFNYEHHSKQRLIALREAESELREEKETVANLRVELAAVTAKRDRLQIMHDEAYIAGMKHGWNCCAAGDEERYKRTVENTREQIRRARAEFEGATKCQQN